MADPEAAHDEEWAERVSLSDTSEYQYQDHGRHSPNGGLDPARTGRVKINKPNVRSRRAKSRPGRRGCCKIIHLNEDNARFILLGVVMVFYMLSGAGIFAALERDKEVEDKRIYRKHIQDFKNKYPEVQELDLQALLDIHSQAESAGFVGNKRPRWDFSGAFYFVGTVVSTIGKYWRLYCQCCGINSFAMSRGSRLNGLHSLVFQPSVPAKFSLICVFFSLVAMIIKIERMESVRKSQGVPVLERQKMGPLIMSQIYLYLFVLSHKKIQILLPHIINRPINAFCMLFRSSPIAKTFAYFSQLY